MKIRLKTTILRLLELVKIIIKISSTRKENSNNLKEPNIVQKMATLRGLPHKFTQIMRLNNLNKLDNNELWDNDMSPVELDKFLRWLKQGLPSDVLNQFVRFESSGLAASIGQVHKAYLKSGDVVAVKVQYPNIRETIETDLKLVGLLSVPVKGALNKREIDFDVNSYRSELRRSLNEEVSYKLEQEALNRAYTYARVMTCVRIPKTYPVLCSDTVLTMEWISGFGFDWLIKQDVQTRTMAAETLVEYFLRSCLEWRELHADPNLENYKFTVNSGEIVVGIIDFGCTKIISKVEAEAISALLLSHFRASEVAILQNLLKLGFNQTLLEPIANKLPAVISSLMEPFASNLPFNFANWNVSEKIAQILGEGRWNFRVAGPASLLYFIRAFSGLVQQVKILGVSVNCYKILQKLIEQGIITGSARATDDQAINIQKPVDETTNQLRILVMEGGVEKVSLFMSAKAVINLEDLIPPEVMSKIAEQKIDIKGIIAKAVNSGLTAQQLFTIKDDNRQITIWID